MALFVLSYDLVKTKDYQKLYTALEEFKAVRILESVWCFNRYNTTAEGLRNYFKQFVDNDDRLALFEVSDWATKGTLASPNDL